MGIKDFDGLEGYAEYSFSIDDEYLLYMIHVSWISGNVDGINWIVKSFYYDKLGKSIN